jgi:hypothetical protein
MKALLETDFRLDVIFCVVGCGEVCIVGGQKSACCGCCGNVSMSTCVMTEMTRGALPRNL